MQRRAFTLLELMIAVIIVGILASLVMPMFQGAIIKAKLAEIFVVIGFFEKNLEILLVEYGWDQIDEINARIGDIKYEEKLGSTELFDYDINCREDPDLCGILVSVLGKSGWLCQRVIYPDRKEWIINDAHDWAKYLNIPGAEHYP